MRNGSLYDIHLGEFSPRPHTSETHRLVDSYHLPRLIFTTRKKKTCFLIVFFKGHDSSRKTSWQTSRKSWHICLFRANATHFVVVDGLIYHCIHHVRTPRGCRISLQQGMYGKLRYPAASNVAGAPCRLQLLCDAELLADAEAEAWWLVGWRTWDLIYHPKTETKDDSGRWTKCYKGCLRPIRLITFRKFGRWWCVFYFDVRIQLAMALGRNFQVWILRTKKESQISLLTDPWRSLVRELFVFI